MVDKAFSFSAASLAASSCLQSLCDLLIIRGALQELEGAAVHRLVELVVDRPDVVRVFRAQQLPAATGVPCQSG